VGKNDFFLITNGCRYRTVGENGVTLRVVAGITGSEAGTVS